MKQMKRIFLVTVSLLIFLLPKDYTQDKILTGKVTAFDSIPLIGVKIKVKSSGQLIHTDSLGIFQLPCNPEDKITLKAAGFYTKTVRIEKGIRVVLINMTLKNGDSNLAKAEKYVDIGYEKVNSKKLVNAVSTLNTKELDFSIYTNIYDLLRGRFPGVNVTNDKITVRGTKTLMGVENNEALLVVDGIIVNSADFGTISPLDIESVNVLKDGSSSVYGSRGANGVVLVTTKKGK